MPHYSDGTIANLGDLVKGKPYNTPYEVTGVVVGIVPNSESCNLRVAFTKPTVWPEDPDRLRGQPHENRVLIIRGYDPAGREQAVRVEVDYGETKAFVKIV